MQSSRALLSGGEFGPNVSSSACTRQNANQMLSISGSRQSRAPGRAHVRPQRRWRIIPKKGFGTGTRETSPRHRLSPPGVGNLQAHSSNLQVAKHHTTPCSSSRARPSPAGSQAASQYGAPPRPSRSATEMGDPSSSSGGAMTQRGRTRSRGPQTSCAEQPRENEEIQTLDFVSTACPGNAPPRRRGVPLGARAYGTGAHFIGRAAQKRRIWPPKAKVCKVCPR